MNEDSKMRSDAKLGRLNPEQRAQLCDVLMYGGMSILQVTDWVKKEFAISCGSTAISNFHKRYCQPLYRARLSDSAQAAEKAGNALKDASVFDAATIAGVKQMVFETISKGADADTVSTLMRLFIELRNQDIKTQQLDLNRDKFQMDFTKAAMEHVDTIKAIKTNTGLDSNAQIAEVRQLLFGIQAGSNRP